MEKLILDSVKNLVGDNTLLGLTITLVFIFTIWLSRQIKSVYEKDKELRKTERENSLKIISEILKQYHTIGRESLTDDEFLKYVQTQLPLLDLKTYLIIRDILEKNLDESSEYKSEKIKNEILKAIKLIKFHDNIIYSESIMETITRSLSNLKDVFIPPIISVLVVLYLVLAFSLGYSQHPFWNITKLTTGLFGLFFLVACLDDMIERKWVLVNKRSILNLIFLIFIPFILILVTSLEHPKLLVAFFIYGIIGVISFLIISILKQRRLNRQS
ncbi:hypothetical protein FPQ02_19320 [Bacillus halotolerans]|uniref:hypothetical protein n=1 Tax=Bacillus halotolerans TaxID=260554 RepID=UPI0027E3EC37|nr:hypothetical protein [Bacillus halotolerans]MDQ7726782.1 hypothetical protein [Bacillus halotolerans]